MTNVPIRHASTLIIVRDAQAKPKVLMGQRGASAAFMPDKFVFPGGAVDSGDAEVQLSGMPDAQCLSRLAQLTDPGIVPSLLACMARELWEETGQILGKPAKNARPANPDWDSFHATGHAPSAHGVRFVFRAITPPGRPRRFDARFFLVDAQALATDLDDFSKASDELSHLHWVALSDARKLNLPFITEVVLAEISALTQTSAPPDSVPFFKNDTQISQFLRLR